MNTNMDATALKLKLIDLEKENEQLKKKLDSAIVINNALEDVNEDLEREVKFLKDNAKSN